VDQCSCRARERGDHQSVPRRNDLVVEVRPRPRGTRVEQHLSRTRHCPCYLVDSLSRPNGHFLDRLRNVRNVLSGELALWIRKRVAGQLDTKPPADDVFVRPEKPRQFAFRPYVERALALFAFARAGAAGSTRRTVVRRHWNH
jgi:hypothetical protein